MFKTIIIGGLAVSLLLFFTQNGTSRFRSPRPRYGPPGLRNEESSTEPHFRIVLSPTRKTNTSSIALRNQTLTKTKEIEVNSSKIASSTEAIKSAVVTESVIVREEIQTATEKHNIDYANNTTTLNTTYSTTFVFEHTTLAAPKSKISVNPFSKTSFVTESSTEKSSTSKLETESLINSQGLRISPYSVFERTFSTPAYHNPLESSVVTESTTKSDITKSPFETATNLISKSGLTISLKSEKERLRSLYLPPPAISQNIEIPLQNSQIDSNSKIKLPSRLYLPPKPDSDTKFRLQ